MPVDDSPRPWEVSPANLTFVEQLYLAYRENPDQVEESWRRAFSRVDRGEPLWPPPPDEAPAIAPPNGSNGHGHGETAAPGGRAISVNRSPGSAIKRS